MLFDLRYTQPQEIAIVIHNGSDYDFTLII